MGSHKKGFVYKFDEQIKSLNVGWYYTWGLEGCPSLSNFIPMVWGAPDAEKLSNVDEILSFNEPDGNNIGAQSNISISQVVSLWPLLKSKAKRVGSVACSQNPLATSYTPHDGSAHLNTSYFDALWTELTARGMQPDFINLHWYAPPNADGFLSWLDEIWAKYQKPLRVTEMCVADWTATATKPNKFSVEQIQTFMDTVVAGMNNKSYVEGYCWKTRPTTDVNMGTGALIALDGTLTPLGVHYSSL